MDLAGKIGHKVRGGEVIELVSDLGGGKTAFVRGLASGMGSQGKVSSPSFTLGNQYRAGRLTLYHFDFYRLNDPGIMAAELAEALAEPQAVVAIEWGGIVEGILPASRLIVHIKALAENLRELTFNYPAGLAYLIPRNT